MRLKISSASAVIALFSSHAVIFESPSCLPESNDPISTIVYFVVLCWKLYQFSGASSGGVRLLLCKLMNSLKFEYSCIWFFHYSTA